MIVLIFDTETSGLPNCGYNKNYIDTKSWPFILQLAYLLYDTDKGEIIKKYCKFIKIDDSVEINENSIKIHNITKEFCQENGDRADIC